MNWTLRDWDRFSDALGDRSSKKPFLKWLKSTDVNLNVYDRYGWNTPLHIAVNWNDLQLIDILLKHGADINIRNGYDWTALRCAVDVGMTETAKHLILRGADRTGIPFEDELTEVIQEHQEAVAQVMVRKGMPQKVIGHHILKFTGFGI